MPFPRILFFAAAGSLALFLGGAADAVAHGSLHEQIASVTAALEKKPADFDLLLFRANLERLHENWDAGTQTTTRSRRSMRG